MGKLWILLTIVIALAASSWAEVVCDDVDGCNVYNGFCRMAIAEKLYPNPCDAYSCCRCESGKATFLPCANLYSQQLGICLRRK
ncbi:hypothetical protein J437_LFUL012291 [Ladona fulva]|uniref:Uncharacterized protein n=1 Tax=Ladona fulva TaxID=123851 RepID=A0A8K0KCD9_LADFU|nr:hypothetical protein J437_LFUL012291 [Ladona fulva]